MGLSSSGDHFCQRTDEAIRRVEGILKLVDDCLGGGKDVPALKIKLRELLLKCREHNLKVLRRKFEIGVKLAFVGFVIDASSGEVVISPDPGRIQAIQRMGSPTNKRQVREFLGLVRTLEAWCPDITAKSNLLRVLANKDTRFLWTEDHESEFQRLKKTSRCICSLCL